MRKDIKTAVIDIGTLKSKFEIRSFDKTYRSKVLYKDKKLTVIGRDLHKTNNMITPKAISTTITALLDFKDKLNEFGVDTFKAVTTEAIRRADNSEFVLMSIKDKTGISVEVLDHVKEAELFFHAISNDFPGEVIAVADIGGGSVQIIVGKDKEIYETYLFKTGTYFMQETFATNHHSSKIELLKAKEYIAEEMMHLINTKYHPKYLIYGSTNIIDFFQNMKIPLEERINGKSHPYMISVDMLLPLYRTIIKKSFENRESMYPEEPYFMWGADMALLNIFQICKSFSIPTVIPTNNNISTGILLDLAKNYNT